MADITVEYDDHYMDDLSIANAARVSFDKRSKRNEDGSLKEGDVRLIQFLARGCESGKWEEYMEDLTDPASCLTPWQKDDLLSYLCKMPTHWAPFAHPHITLRETVPICVARQRFKHKIGFVESEVSRRYVDSTPEFYVPEVWRKRAADKKQGSTDEAVEFISPAYASFCEQALRLYNEMLAAGVCPEQARMVLPQSMMTSYVVTGSLYAFASLYNARTYDGAQYETKDLALKIGAIIEPLFPVSWKALTA